MAEGKVCAQCGQAISDGALTCPECGCGVFRPQKTHNPAPVRTLRRSQPVENDGRTDGASCVFYVIMLILSVLALGWLEGRSHLISNFFTAPIGFK